MEKYSAYRDAGTGIHPFLIPVPLTSSGALVTVLLPLGYIIGVLRVSLLLVVGILYFLLVQIVLNVFYPIAPLYGFLSWAFTAISTRLALFILGLWWIPVVYVTRKRGVPPTESWNPKPGDIIVSNWVSWVEILWLAFRFNPIFVLPKVSPTSMEKSQPGVSSLKSNTHGRRTGTGSAAISSLASRPLAVRVPIQGFHEVSLLRILGLTGAVPPFKNLTGDARSLKSIRKDASRPIVVFPECTTSNGRALLHFADVFDESSIPVKAFKVFVMCARYDPPTLFTPTLTCSIPSFSSINPLPHVFHVATSLSLSLPQSLSIRLLYPAESPSSGSFLASDVLAGSGYKNDLSEACSVLIAQLGKMKMTGQAWEDKFAFLEFYRGKTNR